MLLLYIFFPLTYEKNYFEGFQDLKKTTLIKSAIIFFLPKVGIIFKLDKTLGMPTVESGSGRKLVLFRDLIITFLLGPFDVPIFLEVTSPLLLDRDMQM